ncbi:hypothetical protein BD414DRAFT_490520 [Trametes punicea]|nr:hypothetical protein BD414DRAFT_490520 [Trametes punicea]
MRIASRAEGQATRGNGSSFGLVQRGERGERCADGTRAHPPQTFGCRLGALKPWGKAAAPE